MVTKTNISQLKDQSITAQVYTYILERPEPKRLFSCKSINDRMKWLDKNQISAALCVFEREGRLVMIGKGKYGVKNYQRTDLFEDGRTFINRPNVKCRKRKPYTRTVKPKAQEPAPSVQKKNDIMKEIHELKEESLALAVRLEALWNRLKDINLIL